MRPCSVCGVADTRALFRTSPIGEPFEGAHYSCQEGDLDPELVALCNIIEEN